MLSLVYTKKFGSKIKNIYIFCRVPLEAFGKNFFAKCLHLEALGKIYIFCQVHCDALGKICFLKKKKKFCRA
jgi:hypothetical protein